MKKYLLAGLLICGAIAGCKGPSQQAQSNILEFHPASEIETALLSSRAITVTWGEQTAPAPLTLLHFSDLHGCEENLARIVEFKAAYDGLIDDAIHTGDGLFCYWDDPNPWDTVPGAADILNIVGNHDCWKGHLVWAQTARPYDANVEEAYQKIIAPYAEKWGVETGGLVIGPEGSENAAWYFKDYPESGVRLIALDCIHYEAAQHSWFTAVLDDALANGLTVVGATHYPSSTGVKAIESGFTTPGFSVDPEWNLAGEQYESMPEGAFKAVDSFIERGGKFVCWLSGHTHLDYLGFVAGHEKQLQVIVDKAGYADPYMWEDRTVGSANQDAFNLTTINPSRGMLTVYRVGCQRDHQMRSKKLFSYDYLRGVMLTSE